MQDGCSSKSMSADMHTERYAKWLPLQVKKKKKKGIMKEEENHESVT